MVGGKYLGSTRSRAEFEAYVFGQCGQSRDSSHTACPICHSGPTSCPICQSICQIPLFHGWGIRLRLFSPLVVFRICSLYCLLALNRRVAGGTQRVASHTATHKGCRDGCGRLWLPRFPTQTTPSTQTKNTRPARYSMSRSREQSQCWKFTEQAIKPQMLAERDNFIV